MAFGLVKEAVLVGVSEAFSHPSYQVQRLLDLAETWPDQQGSASRGAERCRTARQVSPAEVDELVTAYAAGATVYELAERFGIHRDTIGKHLRARGLVTVKPGLHPDDLPAALELYRAGQTYAQIAVKFGVGGDHGSRPAASSGYPQG